MNKQSNYNNIYGRGKGAGGGEGRGGEKMNRYIGLREQHELFKNAIKNKCTCIFSSKATIMLNIHACIWNSRFL